MPVNDAPLPVQLQLLALLVLLLFLGWVVYLLRTHKLSLRDSLIWFLTTLAVALITAFPSVLGRIAHAIGVRIPSNAVFGVGLLYLAVNVLSNTIAGSVNHAKVRRLTQECALLREEIERLRSESGAPSRPRDATP